MINISIDSTSLSTSSCLLHFKRTVIGELDDSGNPDTLGGYKDIPNAAMIYGVAVHKFIDVMFRTNGNYKIARDEMDKAFNVPKIAPSDRSSFLADPLHLRATCYNIWMQYIEQEQTFNVIQIPVQCYWCKGKGCEKCKDGVVIGPATELTFKLPFYTYEDIQIDLCGTMDRIGKFNGGCFAIRDWKTTSAYNKDDYFSRYEMDRQLRIYILACKLMTLLYPDSILGKIGATNMGAVIDGIFLKSRASLNEYARSDVFTYSEEEIKTFTATLSTFCEKFCKAIKNKHFPKEGLLNGTCEGKWGKCKFWNVCKSNETVGGVLLKRDFNRKIYNPLAFND